MNGLFKKHVQGFTILEMVIVLAIMGILAVSVLIQWPAATINLGGQAKQLVNDIRYTQTLSMTKGQRYYLIKQSANSYQIMNAAGSPIVLPSGASTVTFSTGITFGTLTNLPNNLIAFSGNGTPYVTAAAPGTALTSTATMPLIAGGNTKTVSITPQTGWVVAQ